MRNHIKSNIILAVLVCTVIAALLALLTDGVLERFIPYAEEKNVVVEGVIDSIDGRTATIQYVNDKGRTVTQRVKLDEPERYAVGDTCKMELVAVGRASNTKFFLTTGTLCLAIVAGIYVLFRRPRKI